MIKSADFVNIQRPPPTNEQAQGDLLYYHKESVQNHSNEEQLIKLCTDAGFVKTVAPGQFFMTKDAGEFSEFDGHVGCREYTLPRDEESPTPQRMDSWKYKNWSCVQSGDPYHQESLELRSELILSGDGSQSWVRISSGLFKFVGF